MSEADTEVRCIVCHEPLDEDFDPDDPPNVCTVCAEDLARRFDDSDWAYQQGRPVGWASG